MAIHSTGDRATIADEVQGRAVTTSGRLSLAASVTLCIVLPVAMVLANKSAPVALALGAVLSNAAAIVAGRSAELRARYWRLLRTGSGLMIAVFFGWAIVSLVWTVSTAMTLRGLSETLPELAFGWALAAAWPLSAKRSHLGLLGLGIGMAAALITFEGATALELHKLTGARAMPFDLKRSSIPPLLLVWPAMALCRDSRHTFRCMLLIGCALLGSLVSHSSASVVAVIVGVVVFGVASRRPRTSASAYLGVALVLLLLAPWTGTVMNRLISHDAEEMLAEQHATQRVAIWSAFEARVWNRPWLGHGYDTSFRLGDAVSGRAPRPGDEVIRDIHPHNQLLQVWIDFGLVGAVGIVAVLGWLARKFSRLDAKALAPRLAFLSSATVMGLVGVQAWDAWWLATLAVVWAAFTVMHHGETMPDAKGT